MEEKSSEGIGQLLNKDLSRLIIESAKDYAIFMLSPEGVIQSWNEGAKRLKGYTEKEIIGQHFSVFYPEEAKANRYPWYELEQAALLGRFENEGLRVKKDGTTFYANVIITALRGDQNELLGFSKITRDLTDRKRTEELLRQSEERYRLLVESVRDYAIYMLSPEGHVLSWNEGAKRLKGYSDKEIIGQHFSVFYPEEKKEEGFPDYELKQAVLWGKFEDEGYRIRKDGSQFFVNAVITPLYSNGKHIGFAKVTRDLTERKQAEERLFSINSQLEQRVKERTEELSKTVKELKMINADLDNFIYTASHDLRAPVSNIEGLVESLRDLLKENDFLTPEVEAMVKMIDTSVLRFQHTVRDLTSINEIQRTGKDDLRLIDLREIVEDVRSNIDHLIKGSKAEFELSIRPSPRLQFSRIHMRSMIFNFMSNAIKYRSPDRTPKIEFSAQEEEDEYVIRIKDNGLGIKEEHQDKIFQLFHRLHHHVEGTGIGLYIVKKIIDNAEGRLDIYSKPNEGSLFTVYLPLSS